MPIYTLKDKKIDEVKRTQFVIEGIQERIDLQSALRDNITVISPNTLIISEEFSEWTEGARRIDLLGIDGEANLVVIELKRDETGVHMELQALRYAALVSTMTFKKAVEIHQKYLDKRKFEQKAEEVILKFLGWREPLEEEFAASVRVVLASGNFSKELTTTVMWLNEQGLNIRCVRLQPYKLGEELLLNIEQIIPLPEAEEYQIQVREKSEAQQASANQPPLVREIRNQCKAAGFARSPGLPSSRAVQNWIREFGEGSNLQDRVNQHIRYWITARNNPAFTHEELKALISDAEENVETP